MNELLQQIKNEVAVTKGKRIGEEDIYWEEVCSRYAAACVDQRATDIIETLKTKLVREWHKKKGDDIYDLIDETFFKVIEPHIPVSKLEIAAKEHGMFTKQQVEEACRKTLEKAAENAKNIHGIAISIDKSSITDPKNITIPEI